MKNYFSWTLLGFVSGLTSVAYAADESQSFMPFPISRESHFVQPRPVGMGEAFTSVADDYNALYYNPAGLAFRKEQGWLTWSLVNPVLGISSSVLDLPDAGIENVNFDKAFKSPEEYEKLRKLAAKLAGKPYYVRAGLNPYFLFKNFGLGLYVNNQASIAVHQFSAGNLAFAEVQSDIDARVGYAHKLWGDTLSLGGALFWRARVNLYEKVDFDKLGMIEDKEKFKELLSSGQGIGADVGVLFKPAETPWEPSLGLAIQNLGDTRMFSTIPNLSSVAKKKASDIPQSVNVGVSVTPRFQQYHKDLFVRVAMDFRDINAPLPPGRKLRLGFEGGLENRITMQLGLSGEYPHFNSKYSGAWNPQLSFGLDARLWIFTLRYATYVVERGIAAGQMPERRHVFAAKIFF